MCNGMPISIVASGSTLASSAGPCVNRSVDTTRNPARTSPSLCRPTHLLGLRLREIVRCRVQTVGDSSVPNRALVLLGGPCLCIGPERGITRVDALQQLLAFVECERVLNDLLVDVTDANLLSAAYIC